MCVMPNREPAAAHLPPNFDLYGSYRDELVEAGHLVPMGVPGLYARGRDFERAIDAFDALVARTGAVLLPETLRFPPVFNRSHYEKLDHIRNFPDLMGSVHTFTGDDRAHRDLLGKFDGGDEDWSRYLEPARVMLTPAICYPLYPTLSNTTLPPGGRRFDLQGYAFRHEPSDDPARMQIFRMHEFVRLGTATEALEHRACWLDLGVKVFDLVGLKVETVVANDPFFGRGGKVQKAIQREQALKFEFTIPICSQEKPTAIGSCNYHVDHFGETFGIRTADGGVAHSACVGFGLERVALALFKIHGLELSEWPREVRDVLALA